MFPSLCLNMPRLQMYSYDLLNKPMDDVAKEMLGEALLYDHVLLRFLLQWSLRRFKSPDLRTAIREAAGQDSWKPECKTAYLFPALKQGLPQAYPVSSNVWRNIHRVAFLKAGIKGTTPHGVCSLHCHSCMCSSLESASGQSCIAHDSNVMLCYMALDVR